MKKHTRINEQKQIELLLESLPQKQWRCLKQEEVALSGSTQLNQFILGENLALRMDWQTLVNIKLKYMFSPSLALELRQEFEAVALKIKQSQQASSRADSFLVSLMRVIASWDVDILVLLVDKRALQFLPPSLRELLNACFMEFTDLANVYFLEAESELVA